MIDLITIEDLGVIESATLPLGAGFTAITGETGAGKTMVITALSLLMGERSDSGLVRAGAERARIVGVVKTAHSAVKDLVEDAGGEIEDKELVIVRTVNSEGRSRASAGGISVPAQTVQKMSPLLFALHGQSEQLRLKSGAKQRETLDRFGGAALLGALGKHQAVYSDLIACGKELEELREARLERVREAERLRAETSEIAEVAPEPNELETLRAEIEKLSNIEELRDATNTAKNTLSSVSDDPFASDAAGLIAIAVRELERGSSGDPEVKKLAELASGLAVQLDELVRELGAYVNSLDASGPEALGQANLRLEALTGLTRKYGQDIDEVLSYQQGALERLESLGGDDLRIEQLERNYAELQAEQSELQKALTQLREAAALELQEKVTEELRTLALPEADFIVSVTPSDTTSFGADGVEMLLKPHPGATPRPIAKGASGGELSRVMLALEVALAGKDPVPTFVFDEIDAGVGGLAAIEIGRRLKRLAKNSQVIVVTHLAQVAAFADNHLMIQKDSSGGFTKSSVRQLDAESRNTEMARLLSGMPDSENALRHARELINLASRPDTLTS